MVDARRQVHWRTRRVAPVLQQDAAPVAVDRISLGERVRDGRAEWLESGRSWEGSAKVWWGECSFLDLVAEVHEDGLDSLTKRCPGVESIRVGSTSPGPDRA